MIDEDGRIDSRDSPGPSVDRASRSMEGRMYHRIQNTECREIQGDSLLSMVTLCCLVNLWVCYASALFLSTRSGYTSEQAKSFATSSFGIVARCSIEPETVSSSRSFQSFHAPT